MTEQNIGFLKHAQKYEKSMKDIGEQTLCAVDAQYGTGFPEYRNGREPLVYHNGYHARVVGKGALHLASELGLDSTLQRLAETAGYAHDILQGKSHEKRSAEWVEKQFRTHGLPKAYAHMAGLAIRGTEPIFVNGMVAGQVATRQSYHSVQAENLALAVASADLGSLYTPSGPLEAHDLYREIHRHARPPMDEDFVDFQRRQVQMLNNYQYPLAVANQVLATHRPQVQAYSEQLLDQLEKGNIEDWQQLRARDEAFYRKHHRH